MNIFANLKKLFSKSGNRKINIEYDASISMTERENEVYGQDKLSARRMYEKWASKEFWLLYDESIPLLLGIDPKIKISRDDKRKNEIEELCLHAQDCVNKKLLPVINNEKQEKEWQVRPVDLYRWATVSRISVPSELNDLMQFVMQTVKPTTIQNEQVVDNDKEDVKYQKHREIVLGAAMSLLASSPDVCINDKGRVMSHLIAKQIVNNKKQWFGEDETLLAESGITDLVEQYLKLARPVL